jgi:hypothetical protein
MVARALLAVAIADSVPTSISKILAPTKFELFSSFPGFFNFAPNLI